ncbi:hypothetical protein BKA93DRAFT_926583 [Sparassis latifolia]
MPKVKSAWRNTVPLRPRDLQVPRPSFRKLRGPVDRCLNRVLANTPSPSPLEWGLGDFYDPASPSIACTTYIVKDSGAIEGIFVDPDTYTLHLAVAMCGSGEDCSFDIAIDTFTCLDWDIPRAPDWVAREWTHDQPFQFTRTKAWLREWSSRILDFSGCTVEKERRLESIPSSCSTSSDGSTGSTQTCHSSSLVSQSVNWAAPTPDKSTLTGQLAATRTPHLQLYGHHDTVSENMLWVNADTTAFAMNPPMDMASMDLVWRSYLTAVQELEAPLSDPNTNSDHSTREDIEARITAAEERGSEVEQEEIQSGRVDLLEPVCDDSSWEDEEDDESQSISEQVEGLLPTASHIPSMSTAADSLDMDKESSPGSTSDADENIPDPFRYQPTPAHISAAMQDVHPNRCVYLIYLLVLWLHTVFHLPFRACNVVLVIFGLILRSAGVVLSAPMCESLTGVISVLDAEPTFQTLPVCPQCLEVFPASIPDDATCTRCGLPLFVTEPTPAEQRSGRSTRRTRKPKLRFPCKSIEEQLTEILALPGVEASVDQWRYRCRVPGEWTDIFDGKICQELKGPDGCPFFCVGAAEAPNDELRIGVFILTKPRITITYILSDVFEYCEPPFTPPVSQNGLIKNTAHLSREAFVKKMIVVDPMHNLFLGVVKTHFYHIWVKSKVLRKNKELRRFHAVLAELYLPTKLGRLPNLIGEPAGGSLTADQWMVLATVVGPLAIPEIWQDYLTREDPNVILQRRKEGITKLTADKKAKKRATTAQDAPKKGTTARPAMQRRRKQVQISSGSGDTAPSCVRRSGCARKPTERAREMELESDDAGALSDEQEDDWEEDTNFHKCQCQDDDDDDENRNAPSNLHPQDVSNFLKLSSALTILLSETLTMSDLDKADSLIRKYCLELIELYGASVIRPNHHYATHTAEFVRDYGPLREFWTFLFERMNKVLKSYRTSNHAGGELECSFFREFHRTVQTSRLLAQGARNSGHSELHLAVEAMYKASADDRGTVQALAHDLDEVRQDAQYKKLHRKYAK